VPGIFITFEGGDGSGKSTQLRFLIDWLVEEGHPFVQSREPGGTEIGVELRTLILHRRGYIAPRAEALLYAADRAQNIATVVRPALAAGSVVVQDRYLDSSVAYQGAGRVLDASEVHGLSVWASEALSPDLTILLDVDPAVGRARIAGGEWDRLEEEQQDFHERVRAGYLSIAAAEPERFLVLDATKSPHDLADLIRQRVSELLS
jgi:dTMP kinase